METPRLIRVVPSTRFSKKLMAEFSDGKIIHFGQFGSSTFLDHQDERKRKAYTSRHSVRENWEDPYTPGTLSRYILWEKRTLEEAIKNYKRIFKV